MARGMLSHLVLHKLAKGPLSGYGICSQIEVSIGHRPSYGSVYPLLEKLAHEGLVSARKDGRKKLYAITPKGREQVRRLDQRREELVGGLMVQVRSLMELTGQNPVPLVASLERLRGGEAPLGPARCPVQDGARRPRAAAQEGDEPHDQ